LLINGKKLIFRSTSLRLILQLRQADSSREETVIYGAWRWRTRARTRIPFFETQFVNEDAWFCSMDRIPFRCTRDQAKHCSRHPPWHARLIIGLKLPRV